MIFSLPALKYLSIECGLMARVEFESIVKNVSSQLEVLNIQHHSDEDYLDADRWEQMIKNHIPNLKEFNYEYRKFDDSEHLENVLVI